jgi:hypothetical protein
MEGVKKVREISVTRGEDAKKKYTDLGIATWPTW